MMQYPSDIPADGMVLHPGVFSYGRLVHEAAFDACILMLLHTCLESTYSLTDIHLSAGAWHFVDDVCLFLHREGS